MKFGLENISALMRQMGNPQQRFPSVLIAGTNGKGSVTAMVDAALRAGGFRSARYTSPHLTRLEERFVIDGAEVTTEALASAVTNVREAVESLLARSELTGPATFFECATAAAFELFSSSAVDIAVLEVGLGGRLDATNIVTPLVCAITTIDLDHQAQLGTTLESIAAEKAGIIKAGVPVVIGRLPDAAEAVVASAAGRASAPVVRADGAGMMRHDVQPSLAGAHQRDNAAVAVAVLDVLATQGFAVSKAAVARALQTVQWPGRLEMFQQGENTILMDAAHNPGGAAALAAYLSESGWTDATLVFAAMADKDAKGMLAVLAPVVPRIICTTAPTPRAASAGELAAVARAVRPTWDIEIVDEPAAALGRACARSARVVVAGSMFLIGPLRGILR